MRQIVWTDEAVAEFPDCGRNVGDGRREMTTVRPYVLRYRVETDRVIVLRIRHGARLDEDGG